MNLALNDIQYITMRDILIDYGLSGGQIERIMLLLAFKKPVVQKAFYYRAHGMTFNEIGERIERPRTTVQDMIHRDCEDIASYLRDLSAF